MSAYQSYLFHAVDAKTGKSRLVAGFGKNEQQAARNAEAQLRPEEQIRRR